MWMEIKENKSKPCLIQHNSTIRSNTTPKETIQTNPQEKSQKEQIEKHKGVR